MTGTPVPLANWEASGYRLPTEAEWEYACREGKDAGARAFHSGPITSPGTTPPDRNLDEAGWYAGNSGGNSRPVGLKKPNAFGLYDMHGNAAEWCWDLANMLTTDEVEDPRGGEAGPFRMFRGGSWADPARCCRSAYRAVFSPIAPSSFLVGFRPASSADPKNDISSKPKKR
jgi:formylglycine-generating enzyme